MTVYDGRRRWATRRFARAACAGRRLCAAGRGLMGVVVVVVAVAVFCRLYQLGACVAAVGASAPLQLKRS